MKKTLACIQLAS